MLYLFKTAMVSFRIKHKRASLLDSALNVYFSLLFHPRKSDTKTSQLKAVFPVGVCGFEDIFRTVLCTTKFHDRSGSFAFSRQPEWPPATFYISTYNSISQHSRKQCLHCFLSSWKKLKFQSFIHGTYIFID